MAQLTVGKLDEDLVRRLKIRAAQHNRSVEAEHRAILKAALQSVAADFWEKARQAREESRVRAATDSTEIVRQDRDRRHRIDS